MPLYNPQSFYSEAPPARLMGAECEYDVQGFVPDDVAPEDYSADDVYLTCERIWTAAVRAGYSSNSKSGYLLKTSGARAYIDQGFLEYAAPESEGPLEATLTDFAGMVVVRDIVNELASASEQEATIYRRSGTSGYSRNTGIFPETKSSGYHENFLAPDDGVPLALLYAHLATRVWAGGGMVDAKYHLFQKAKGTNTQASTQLKTRSLVDHGEKPMLQRLDDTLGFSRIEVRAADPLQSPKARFLAFATNSLVLRLIEHPEVAGLKKLYDFIPRNPGIAYRMASADLSFNQTYKSVKGYGMTALDMQEMLLVSARNLAGVVQLPADELVALPLWQRAIDGFRRIQSDPDDYGAAALISDAIAKYAFMRKYLHSHSDLVKDSMDPSTISNSNATALSLDYLWDRVGDGYGASYWTRVNERHPEAEIVVNEKTIRHYTRHNPTKTRAMARKRLSANGYIINSWPEFSADKPSGLLNMDLHPYATTVVEALLAA